MTRMYVYISLFTQSSYFCIECTFHKYIIYVIKYHCFCLSYRTITAVSKGLLWGNGAGTNLILLMKLYYLKNLEKV